jgi:enoyl-CoA hydratase/carnithine racemase
MSGPTPERANSAWGSCAGPGWRTIARNTPRTLTWSSDKITAQLAKELGLVNEVMPLERLLPRVWELAEKIMQKPRAIRRLTGAVLRRQWKRRLVQDLGFHITHELLGMHLNK